MSRSNRLLAQLDAFPYGALWRLAFGAAGLPTVHLLCRGLCHAATLFVLFIALLLALRVIPLMLRKLLRPDAELREIWASRRRLAKEFDSYQWQKLFWIGAGMVVWIMTAGAVSSAELVLATVSMVAGMLGMFFWRREQLRSSINHT